MIFNSYSFIIFFACVLILHNLPLPWSAKKFNLLVASYLFYAAWNPPFVILLWFSTLADWYFAKWIAASQRQATRRLFLLCSLGVGFGLLGFFKYGTFVTRNLLALLQAVGVDIQLAAPNIILPVGISFYTFQSLSYTIDVYRGRMSPCKSFLDYALYVTFFPQLVAGPITRAHHFLPQCEQPRRPSSYQLQWGLSLLILGLFQKMVVADGLLAPITEDVFDTAMHPDFWSAWTGTIAFAGQIFCDFAGYSTCAIGAATCLGFTLHDNFRAPYAAVGFSDFWRRWHISLSEWLRDYLYVPLGGNRKGSVRTHVNLMITMLLGGLWHGASWTFVIWGGLHGMYLVMERFLRAYFSTWPLFHTKLAQAILGCCTFLLVCLAWVFFRAESLTRANAVVASMFGWALETPDLRYGRWESAVVFGTVGLIICSQCILRERNLETVAASFHWIVRALVLAILLLAIIMMTGDDRAFIYFQF